VNGDWNSTIDRVAELRRAFDRSFAEAPPSRTTALEDLLDVRIGATPYALRITEISGLFADTRIALLPTTVPALLGIAAFRGSIVPVYDLRAMLAHPIHTKPRWLAIAAGTTVGLAFDAFEGHVRVHADAIVPHGSGDAAVRHVRAVVRLDGLVRPIVSIASVLEEITNRVRGGAPDKE
jgi:purine-binding chemotaxis protein CheW